MADASAPTVPGHAAATGSSTAAPARPNPKPDAAPGAKHGSFWPSFHEVLSALNPLQYVPVVGTLYRSLTGDTIPETTRMAGSLVFSGLTSGPIGVATSLAADFLERTTGIDPERIGHNILASLGIGTRLPGSAAPAESEARVDDLSGRIPVKAQLAAYGFQSTADKPMQAPSDSADELNARELVRLHSQMNDTMLASKAYIEITGSKGLRAS